MRNNHFIHDHNTLTGDINNKLVAPLLRYYLTAIKLICIYHTIYRLYPHHHGVTRGGSLKVNTLQLL